MLLKVVLGSEGCFFFFLNYQYVNFIVMCYTVYVYVIFKHQ